MRRLSFRKRPCALEAQINGTAIAPKRDGLWARVIRTHDLSLYNRSKLWWSTMVHWHRFRYVSERPGKTKVLVNIAARRQDAGELVTTLCQHTRMSWLCSAVIVGTIFGPGGGVAFNLPRFELNI
jgi:hypothetical protein